MLCLGLLCATWRGVVNQGTLSYEFSYPFLGLFDFGFVQLPDVIVSAQALLTAEAGGNRELMVRLLFSDKYLFLLSSCASELDLNMSDVENNHAHCKHNSPEGTSAELVCAKHVLR